MAYLVFSYSQFAIAIRVHIHAFCQLLSTLKPSHPGGTDLSLEHLILMQILEGLEHLAEEDSNYCCLETEVSAY